MEDYTPKIIEGNYATMLVEVAKCKFCGSWMIERCKHWNSPFPKYIGQNFIAQVHRARWKFRSMRYSDEVDVCEECVQTERFKFTCYLCKKAWTTDNIQASFGYMGQDHLCKICYNTTSASVWASTVKELEEKHKYDFE